MEERISIQKEELIPRELESLVSLKGYKCVILHADKQYVSYIDNVIHIIREIMGNYFEVETLSDSIKPQESIREKISNLLKDCVLGIVILDGLRPNVILEYGALLALGKPVIVLRDENAEIDIKNLDDSLKGISNPKLDIDKHLSDVKGLWCPPYDWRNPKELKERLENDLKKFKDDILAEIRKSFSTREIDRLDTSNYKKFQDEFIKLAEYIIGSVPPKYEQIKVIDENIHHLANKSKVRLSSKYYFELGNIYEKLAKHEEAIGSYDKAIEIDPDNVYAWNNKGTALGELGRHDEALKCFDKILEIDPENAHAWNNKGVALGRLSRYDEALECFSKAIEIDPNNARIWSNKGATLGELGRYDEALRCYDKAIEIDPNYAGAWYDRACIYSLKKDKENMLKNLVKAIELDPDFKEKAKKDEDFKNFWDDEDFRKIVNQI